VPEQPMEVKEIENNRNEKGTDHNYPV
jgi:hypothetical protein